MNVPLSWLSEYVKLPKSVSELTDRLTMVGHMLDKQKEVNSEKVIDLELRGNRADMFGLIGVARDVSAIFNTPLKLPKIAPLPSVDKNMPLIKADKSILGLVKRYMAVKMNVTVGPSPAWLKDQLIAYGIDPINNVVDVTNYVMVETSHPMHAFDAKKLTGDHLVLRRAKSGEKFETIQQGTTLRLTPDDIAICDKVGVQCLTCIGGAHTKVTDAIKTIILETAVYDSANCRRTARRHKVSTEGGGRHEKHQDPHELAFALARAVYLLQEIAHAKIIGGVSDYYPNPIIPTIITFDPQSVRRLAGIAIPTNDMVSILKRLEFKVELKKTLLLLSVPTFRTDIKQEADVVEEIIRIYGYEKIPSRTLSGELPKAGTPPHVLFIEKIRNTLQNLQMNEVITVTLIPNTTVAEFDRVITIINAPDPEIATLRPSMLPNLVNYAKRSLGFRQKRIAFFELGNIYSQPKPKSYKEHMTLGLIMGGEVPSTWNRQAHPISLFDLKGVVEGLVENLGIAVEFKPDGKHPSLGKTQATIFASGEIVGNIGLLKLDESLICAELDVQKLMAIETTSVQPYVIAPLYPPIVEDMSCTVSENFQMGPFIETLKTVDPRIQSVALLDIYENKRMLRITYADSTRTLTNDDISPIREKIKQMLP